MLSYFPLYGRYGPGMDVIMCIVGLGLIYNSVRGLMSREGMYDSDSTQWMTWAGILGVVVGAGMVLYSLGYFLRIFAGLTT